jgi:hypothetical protein
MKKYQWLAMGLAAGLTAFASGCTVRCHFEREVDLGKEGVVTESCRGTVKACNPGDTRCRNEMTIECDDIPIYCGPYTVELKNNTIKYVATDWHGPDAPFIKSEIPKQDHDEVDAWVRWDDQRADGECRYDSMLPATH